jgi:hypothetical protein
VDVGVWEAHDSHAEGPEFNAEKICGRRRWNHTRPSLSCGIFLEEYHWTKLGKPGGVAFETTQLRLFGQGGKRLSCQASSAVGLTPTRKTCLSWI